jgi:hypothetical protein
MILIANQSFLEQNRRRHYYKVCRDCFCIDLQNSRIIFRRVLIAPFVSNADFGALRNTIGFVGVMLPYRFDAAADR